MNKKILITGGAGYIGSHMVRFLIDKGINPKNIIIFDNLSTGNKEFIPKEVIFKKGDLKNKEDLKKVFEKNKIDFVIHFAALSSVGESMKYPEKYFENNVVGGLNLLNIMEENGVKKIINSSTAALYGIPKKIPITEDVEKNPINPYGESKLIFEKLLEWYSKIYNIKYVALRYFNVVGAGFGIGEKHVPETHLFPLLLDSIVENKTFKIFGNDYSTKDGTCERDYVHVLDLVNAHYLALKYLEEGRESEKINIGTGKGESIKTIINIAEEVIGKKINYEIKERREGDPPVLIADNNKSKEILNWNSEKTIEDSIKDAYEWQKELKEFN